MYRALVAGAVATVASLLIVVLPLGGQPCMERDGLRFETIWPRPDHCLQEVDHEGE